MALDGKIALVTGASRGIGRGIALQLGAAGATVYVTGRHPKTALSGIQEDLPTLQKTADEINERGGKGIPVYVDHENMDEVEKLFEKIKTETDGQLDVLVNNAFAAVNALGDAMGKPFWECDPELWDTVNNVGLRNHYYCSVYAARMMVPNKKGLIINISSFGGLKYLFNVSYGVGKCAMDRMAQDMAQELKSHNVVMLALWPGIARTELVGKMLKNGKFDTEAAGLTKLPSESPEYSGKAVVALASDPNIMKKAGRIIITADAAIDYKFKDIDGAEPGSVRSFRTLLSVAGLSKIGDYFPPWLRVPGWIMTACYSRL